MIWYENREFQEKQVNVSWFERKFNFKSNSFYLATETLVILIAVMTIFLIEPSNFKKMLSGSWVIRENVRIASKHPSSTRREILHYYDHYLVESKKRFTNLAPKKILSQAGISFIGKDIYLFARDKWTIFSPWLNVFFTIPVSFTAAKKYFDHQ